MWQREGGRERGKEGRKDENMGEGNPMISTCKSSRLYTNNIHFLWTHALLASVQTFMSSVEAGEYQPLAPGINISDQ